MKMRVMSIKPEVEPAHGNTLRDQNAMLEGKMPYKIQVYVDQCKECPTCNQVVKYRQWKCMNSQGVDYVYQTHAEASKVMNTSYPECTEKIVRVTEVF